MYLIFAPNEQGNVLLTEYYLINKPESAAKYLSRVTDFQSKQELQAYTDLVLRGTEPGPLSQKPKTEVGRLLQSINSLDYAQISTLPLLSELNSALNPKSNQLNQSLSLAEYYISRNQPHLAIHALNILKNSTGELPVINSLLAESYFKLGSKESLTYITKSIEQAPEDQAYYQAGIAYALYFKDKTKADFWSQRLKDLQNIQR